MLKKILTGIVLLSIIFVSLACESGPLTIQEKDAFIAAENWLVMVDKGEYAESWKETAEYCKRYYWEKRWVKSLENKRGKLGKVTSRKLISIKYSTIFGSLYERPGSVSIEFNTSFEHQGKVNFPSLKDGTIESLELVEEKDGKWRVVAYNIKSIHPITGCW